MPVPREIRTRDREQPIADAGPAARARDRLEASSEPRGVPFYEQEPAPWHERAAYSMIVVPFREDAESDD
jgi:hypothetical protein